MMKFFRLGLAAGLVALALASSVGTGRWPHPAPAAASQSASSTRAGDPSLYPNPQVTPGDVLTTDAGTVCTPGYTRRVRNVPAAVKMEVYQEYDVPYPPSPGAYEVDHFVPLELGGSNEIANLWPEPAEPKPGFHEKDQVENYLHGQVCSGAMALHDAQEAIRSDWYKVYQAMIGGPAEPATRPGTPSGPARVGDPSLYPDPRLTPGDILTTDTRTVCTPGYTRKVRNVPVSEKMQVYEEYNLSYPQPRGAYEVDHFIPLELGGSNDLSNLWPEPADPRPGFHEKDEVENYLHDQVCAGKITLPDAQEAIRSDWYKVYESTHP